MTNTDFSEKDMEDWLYAHPESLGCYMWHARQLGLPNGQLDLLGEDVQGNLVLVEVKKVRGEYITYEGKAVFQVVTYASDLARILKMIGADAPIRRVVVANTLYDLFTRLACQSLGVELYTMDYLDDWFVERAYFDGVTSDMDWRRKANNVAKALQLGIPTGEGRVTATTQEGN